MDDYKNNENNDQEMSLRDRIKMEEERMNSYDRTGSVSQTPPPAEKNKKGVGFSKLFFIALLAALLGSGITLAGIKYLESREAEPSIANQAGDNNKQTQKIEITGNEGGTTVENAVAKKAIPSIVGITTIKRGTYSHPFLSGIPAYSESVGSGVIVSSDGYILTNSHVVGGGEAEKVNVLFSDNQEVESKVLWADPTLDLAMIKVERTGLAPIEFAKNAPEVGDKAIAVGNPLGLDLQSTLTSGYISGLDRSITLQDGNTMDGLIQTDAAINGGNSGGALLNALGQLVGINTAKPQSADGIGFAIPSTSFKKIVDKIVAEGEYKPLYLGISGYNVQVAARMGMDNLPVDKGVVIQKVASGSPADRAGLKSGDILVGIDDKKTDSLNGLKTQLVSYKEGQTAKLSYYRNGKEASVEVTFSDFDFKDI